MNQQYTARIYSNEKIIQYKSGDDIEKGFFAGRYEISHRPHITLYQSRLQPINRFFYCSLIFL
ncbi:TPA: hypothetical protein JBC30_10840 [Legionella pneumophila subsp. pneumophila]|nr:hypothetical protein [Legionella pneumophila subsp. pneumophila]